MRDEFLFGIGKTLLTFQELEKQMDAIIKDGVLSDFAFMDKRMVEIYDQRQESTKNTPYPRSLGKMPIGAALLKFR